MSLEQRIVAVDAALPQTQCQQCGYPRCREYARALAQGNCDINRCPPGGEATIVALANLLNTQVIELDTSLGEHRPAVITKIRESECIGCTLCIQICPTDAITGAAKLMHTVIAEDCSGCELCLPVCPVDCIDTLPAPTPDGSASATTSEYSDTPAIPTFTFYSHAKVAHYRVLTNKRLNRIGTHADSVIVGSTSTVSTNNITTASLPDVDRDSIRNDIAAAVARRRTRRQTDSD